MFGINLVNLMLAFMAGLASVGILRQVSGRLATSWQYLLIAFLVLAVAEFLGVIDGGMRLFDIGKGPLISLLFQVGHLVFVILAFTGLWHQYKLLKRLTGGDDD